jgi:CDP-paratose 2-epimerase
VSAPVAIVTGSGGLIGSESARYFAEQGFDVVGIDNDMRAYFFGPDASTDPNTKRLSAELGNAFRPLRLDIRDAASIARVFAEHSPRVELVVHTAAQPSHDWAASEPQTDFTVNANGTLNLLEAARRHAPDATFVFTSTNKVYGDTPNQLPLVELETRLELPVNHRWHGGIDLEMSIDRSTHSLFGVSKVAADLLVQEYGRYFQMPTVCFRGGCLTGPQHAGAQLHGFLAYLMRCTVTGAPYTVFGYDGKQVRDNIHANDVVRAFHAFHGNPRPAAVYNLGGGRESNVSMIEAVELCQEIAGRELDRSYSPQARIGDHRWWISDLESFKRDHPQWRLTTGIRAVLQEIHDVNVERWIAEAPAAGAPTSFARPSSSASPASSVPPASMSPASSVPRRATAPRGA